MYKIDKELLDIIKKTDTNTINYFIRPYYGDTDGLGQRGSTSDKFNLLKEQTSFDFCSGMDGMYSLSLKEFDILAEIPVGYKKIRIVVGHIFGYLINQYDLFEDIENEGCTFIEFDSVSEILGEFWYIMEKVYTNKLYEECLRLIKEPDAHIYIATNIDIIEELYSPKVEDLIMSCLIPSYFDYNNFSIYNVIKAEGRREFLDDFTTIMFSKLNNEVLQRKYLKEMTNELGYTLIKDNECSLQLLSKKIQYGFLQLK